MARPHVKRTKLHHLCDRAGLTQRMFAEQVGADESTTSLWLSGKRMPSANAVPKIAEVLGMEPNYLLGLFVAMEMRRLYGDSVCRFIYTHLNQLAEEDWS